MSEQQKEYLTEIDRREWSEKDILKKILFEDRKIVSLLQRLLVIVEEKIIPNIDGVS